MTKKRFKQNIFEHIQKHQLCINNYDFSLPQECNNLKGQTVFKPPEYAVE